MIDETQAARLAAATNALRPDWPLRSLQTFISNKLAGRAYKDVAVALAYVAADEKTKTPARVLEAGPWWRITDEGGARRSHNMPCPDHAGETLPCGRCANERVPADVPTAAALARAELAMARAHLCSHGIDRKRARCGECERPTPGDPAACKLPGRETSETTEESAA